MKSANVLRNTCKNLIKVGDDLAQKLRALDLQILHSAGETKQSELGEIMRWEDATLYAEAAIEKSKKGGTKP